MFDTPSNPKRKRNPGNKRKEVKVLHYVRTYSFYSLGVGRDMDDRDPLPLHIIDDILSQLHVKQLLRLRCVSKTWRDLIDGPDFIKLQLSRNQARDRSIITVGLGSTDTLYEEKYENGCIATKLDHPWMDSKQWIEVVGCCNGLLCIATNRLPQTLAIWTHLRESTAFYRRQRLPWSPKRLVAFFMGLGMI